MSMSTSLSMSLSMSISNVNINVNININKHQYGGDIKTNKPRVNSADQPSYTQPMGGGQANSTLCGSGKKEITFVCSWIEAGWLSPFHEYTSISSRCPILVLQSLCSTSKPGILAGSWLEANPWKHVRRVGGGVAWKRHLYLHVCLHCQSTRDQARCDTTELLTTVVCSFRVRLLEHHSSYFRPKFTHPTSHHGATGV
jgi:hypothetical protein